MRDFPKKGKNRPKMNKSPENKKSLKNAKIAQKFINRPRMQIELQFAKMTEHRKKKGNEFAHSAKLQKSMKKTKLPKNKKSKTHSKIAKEFENHIKINQSPKNTKKRPKIQKS